MAGQVEKVICNGIYTDNWGWDKDNNYFMGEWDPLDLAEKIFTSPKMYCIFKSDDRILSVTSGSGEYSEKYTVYLRL